MISPVIIATEARLKTLMSDEDTKEELFDIMSKINNAIDGLNLNVTIKNIKYKSIIEYLEMIEFKVQKSTNKECHTIYW